MVGPLPDLERYQRVYGGRLGWHSWYGPGFHGRLTANGEVYNQYAISAAHQSPPLPSYIHVTNLEMAAHWSVESTIGALY